MDIPLEDRQGKRKCKGMKRVLDKAKNKEGEASKRS